MGTIYNNIPGNAPTDNVYLNSLIIGGSWTPSVGTGANLTWSTSAGKIYLDVNAYGSAWLVHETNALKTALQTWSNVANVQFNKVNGIYNSDLRYFNVSAGEMLKLTGDSTTLGLHEVPDGSTQTPLYGMFNKQGIGWSLSGLKQGSFGFLTLIHEIGHGLGLAHPHDGNTIFPGVTSEFGSLGDNNLNQGIWTVMSYNDGWVEVPTPTPALSYGQAGTPMAFDIATIQYIYGANTTYKTGNDTYLLPTSNASGTYWNCIWDAGGIDTISAATSRVSAEINLNAAPLTGPNAAGFVSHVGKTINGTAIVGGFTIANNVVIENATGGSADDILIGNQVNNLLLGNAGNDAIYGNAGNDALDGGVGIDTLVGGAGDDTYVVDIIATTTVVPASIVVTGAALQDTITENAGEGTADTLKLRGSVTITAATIATEIALTGALANIDNLDISLTGTTRLNITGNSENNFLTGNAANNILTGGDGMDILFGGAGVDTMIGGLGIDTYVVDNIADVVIEQPDEGDLDMINSFISFDLSTKGANVEFLQLAGTATVGTGNDLDNGIFGNSLANILSGGAGDDEISGGLGDDILNGGTGADTMNGGDGNDTYFVDDAGDTVTENNASVATGGADTVNSSLNDYTLTTNVENLTLTGANNINGTGNALNNTITGNAGNNELDGAAGNDILNSGNGNDTLTGGAGIDKLTGGKGDDSYNIDLIRTSLLATSTVALQDTVSELANAVGSTVEGIDTINLTNLTGNAGAPTDFSNITNATTLTVNANIENFDASQTGNFKLNITGNTLENIITGNAADNILDGGLNDGKRDTLIGRDGNDTYLVDISPITTGTPPAPVVVTGAQLQDDITENNGEGIDTLKLRGSVTIPPPAAQDITLTGALANIENLDVSLTGTTRLNLTGNSADNILTGNAANNTLTGGFGNDKLDGGLGADTMDGGDGNDTYVIDNVLDVIAPDSSGTDIAEIRLTAGTYALSAGSGIENVILAGVSAINATGDTGANSLTGNAAANTLNGGGGTDTLTGGDGGDTYIVDSADDVIKETNALAAGGIDLVQSSVDFDLSNNSGQNIRNNIENLTLTGSAALGTGNALNNIITGNAGANTLDGKAGVDSLNGGLGDDTYIVDLIKPTPASTTVVLQDTVTEGLNAGTDNIILRGGTIATTATTLLTLGANIEGLDARGDNVTTGTGTTKLNITGNTLDNTLRGNDADNTIDGGIGNDFLRAYDGNDTLLGGAGNDFLDGDSGNDTLDGGAGVDVLQGDQGDDTYIVDIIASGIGVNTTAVLEDSIVGDAQGVDTLRLRGNVITTNASIINLGQIIQIVGQPNLFSIENADASLTGTTKLDFIGSNQDNNIIGNAANNNITGETGDDKLFGGAGNDTLSGGIGVDALDGGIGIDTMDGGEGDDTYVLDVIADSIINETGTSGIDTAKVAFTANLSDAKFNNIENLVLTGAAVNGTGNALTNDITGNDGANTLDGGLDIVADTLRGGKGNDIYIVRAGDSVIENFNEGIDLIRSTISFDLLQANNVENLTLLNASGVPNDPLNNINAFGNDLANILTGNDGDNSFIGAAGADTLIGGKGNDRYNVNLKLSGVEGTSTAAVTLEDTITESTLATDGLEDTLNLVGSYNLTKASTITLATGLEYLTVSGTNTTLLNLTGNSANNIIEGNDADNIIDGAAGTDTLTGFKGNDTYIVDIVNDALKFNLQDAIFEEFGTLGSSDGNDTLRLRGSLVIPAAAPALTYDLNVIGNGNLENIDASLTGTTRINLTGNGENNTLTGNAANNTLNGGTGDDTLIGGLGADTMIGGAGADTYYVDNINDVVDESGDINNNDAVFSSISYTIGATADIEGLTLTGVAAINGTGNDAVNFINGNSAANILIGGGNVDYLSGLAGADTLDGGTDADEMTGGDGNDTYIVDNTGDVVREFNANAAVGGIDLVRVNIVNPVSGTYVLTNSVENAILINTIAYNLTGNVLNNNLTGNVGANTIDGGLGADTMTGGDGNDIYIVDNIGDAIIEVAPPIQDNLTMFDTIQTSISYTASNNVERMVLTGTDNINGSTNNIFGTQITGNIGNNILKGGIGFDTLIGGAGDDTYITTLGTLGFQNLPAFQQTTVARIQDTISESANGGNDTLVLSGSIAVPTGRMLIALNIAGSPNQPAYLIFNNGITQNIENVDISQTGATLLDIDGNNDANRLIGNSANNILIGNAGNDRLDGGLGNDTLNGGIGDDTYVLNVATDIITGETDGNDTAEVAFTASLLDVKYDNIENLTLTGTAALNATGDEGDNILKGNDGNNILDGGAGADDMDGGKGADTYIVGLGDDVSELFTAAQGGGVDTVMSSISFELDDNIENLTLVNVSTTANVINNINATGNALANTLFGNIGDNSIDGDDGADRMTGGDGNDTYFVDNIGDVVSETNIIAAVGGIDTVNSEISYILGANLENLTLIDDDDINGTGNTLANNIIGNAGDNVLDGGASITIVDTLTGGTGNDTYVVDLTVSGIGDATSFTIQDTVTESVGQGTDTLRLRGTLGYVAAKTLTVDELAGLTGQSIEGLDVSLTGSSKINLTGNSADNILVGNAFTNTLIGDAGNDILDGKTGADILNGGAGNDTYFVDVIKPATLAGGDVIIEDNTDLNFGNDTVNTTFSADLNSSQFNGIENLTLLATALNATGDAGDNELIGNAGNNTIKGEAGDDEITGGAGNDTLTGGIGADTFVWELADKGTNGRPAVDKIMDFNIAEDRLDLRDLLEGESGANILNFLDVTTSTAAGVTNTEIRISNTGGFAGGTFAAAAENQHITLAGINLLSGTNEADLIANLIVQNKLIID